MTEKKEPKSNKSQLRRTRIETKKSAKRAIARNTKNIQKLNASSVRLKQVADKKVEVMDKLLGEGEDSLVLDSDLNLTPAIQKQVDEGDVDLVFKPNPGPQTAFLAAGEQEVLYGGAAGGGKSYAMIMDPLRWAHNKNMRALLVRRSMNELTEMIALSRDLYPRIFKGAKYSMKNTTWTFPSGATLWFSFFDGENDKMMYQGQSFTWIGIDEITQYPTSSAWEWFSSRLRSSDPELSANLSMRCTANPGGVGEYWVQRMFVDPAPWGENFWAQNLDTGETMTYMEMDGIPKEMVGKPLFKRRFIPAKLQDNPALMHDMSYITNLMSLPEAERRRLLEGEWGVSDSAAFAEFRPSVHVINPHEYPDKFPNGQPPKEWRRFRMCDWGYVAPSAVLWGAIDYDDNIYIYRELYAKGLDPEALAMAIFDAEEVETRPIPGVLDAQCWENRGTAAKSIADVMISLGLKWQKAPKGPGSRLIGKAAIHRALRVRPETQQPTLKFFTACANTIRTLPVLPLDPKNPEDIDTHFAEDHIYDALRYGLTSPLAKRGPVPGETSMRRFHEQRRPVSKRFGW